MPRALVRSSAPSPSRLPVARIPLPDRVEFSRPVSEAQFRFLVYILACHQPDSIRFTPTLIPVEYVFGPLAVGAPTPELSRIVLDLFGSRCPCLKVTMLEQVGVRVRRTGFAVMPLLTSLKFYSQSRRRAAER